MAKAPQGYAGETVLIAPDVPRVRAFEFIKNEPSQQPKSSSEEVIARTVSDATKQPKRQHHLAIPDPAVSQRC